jgi:signal transduction histidine kinase
VSDSPAPVSSGPETEQLRRLTEIGRALTYTTSLEQVAQIVVERGAELLDAPAALLMLADAEGLLHVRATHGIEENQVSRFRAPFTEEITTRLQGLLSVREEFFLAVPLVVGGSVTGLVAVALRRPFTAADEWLLSALADQAAVALESARLSGEVRLEMEGRLRASEGETNAKDRALATLAHDIRTPLGAIDGYCQIILDELYGPVTDKQREALGRVQMSGHHLLSLLDSVLDMARLNAGVSDVAREPVALVQLAREAIHMVTPTSEAKLQTLTFVESGEVTVRGDGARVRQVIVNLLGNAVKFTPEGGAITVVTAVRVDNGVAWGETRVSDTGPGIPEADLSAIFEPYYRSAGTAALPGVGLGLAISHALMRQMGGDLLVESKLGVGSTFVLRLPVAGRRSGSAERRERTD